MRRFETAKKRIQRILICLVIGVFTSVGITWVIEVTIDVSNGMGDERTKYLTSLSKPHLVFEHHLGTTWEVIDAYARRGFYSGETDYPIKKAPWWSSSLQKIVIERVPPYQRYVEVASGWPMVCMKRSFWFHSRSAGTSMIDSGFLLELGAWFDAKLLSTQPIWTGLILNSMFYATVTWLVLLGRIRLRDSIRRKRGLCIHCRYNIRDLPVCPECGSEVVSFEQSFNKLPSKRLKVHLLQTPTSRVH